MIEKKVVLKEISKVQAFNVLCSHCDYDVELKQGKYVVDAKSIMGIFSLNLEEPAVLVLNTEDEGEVEKFRDYMDVRRG